MPALTPVVDSLDKVPEAARTFYEQKDGKYHVILDAPPAGFVTAAEHNAQLSKVVEFRDNNVKLVKEVEELRPLKTQFEGINPTEAKDAIAKVAELGKKGVTKAEDVATQIKTAVEAVVKPIQDQLNAAVKATEAERKRADDSVLKSEVTARFIKAGGKAKAVDYILNQATSVFKVEGGEVKALAGKFSSERPGETLGLDEWIGSAAKEHDFAFERSAGGGAEGRSGGSGAGRAGQTVIRDPSPQDLGSRENAKLIKEGKLRFEYSK